MAKLFLAPNDTNYTVNISNTTVYGTSSSQTMSIGLSITGIVVDANVEGVQFSGALSDYKFQQTGNRLEVYATDGTTLISKIGLQGDSDGTQLSFSNGTFDAKYLAGVSTLNLTIGGQTVNDTTPTMVAMPLLSMGTTSFDFSTDPTTNFSKSGSAFGWSGAGGVITIPSPSDEIWTLNQAAPVTVNNDTYTVSAFIYNGSGNSGYAALGFSTNSSNSSTNNGVIGSSASPVANSFLGVSFQGGGGNFLNDGIDATNLVHAELPANAWYKVVFSARETSNTTFDLILDIYDASSSSVVSSPRYHTTKAVTNSNIANSAGLYPYFANEGSRLDSLDNFAVTLYNITNFATIATSLADGSATVDVTGATSQQITDLISNISKVSTGGLTGSISLTAAQFTALEAALNSSATLTVTDTSIAATALIAMDAKSLNPVNATAVTMITGITTDVISVVNAAGITKSSNFAVTLSDVGSQANTDAILSATSGTVTTGQLTAGTYANFVAGDKIDTGLTFATHTTTTSANDSLLTWNFASGTLTYESTDTGTATNVALVLTGITSVTEAAGVFTLA
ncbi:MAG: hypothetical protein PHQ03_01055 [Methylococcales bacterium]|nr:hypothetical protein [Methylococcales bacterium]